METVVVVSTIEEGSARPSVKSVYVAAETIISQHLVISIRGPANKIWSRDRCQRLNQRPKRLSRYKKKPREVMLRRLMKFGMLKRNNKVNQQIKQF